jgi:hypothetical protein
MDDKINPEIDYVSIEQRALAIRAKELMEQRIRDLGAAMLDGLGDTILAGSATRRHVEPSTFLPMQVMRPSGEFVMSRTMYQDLKEATIRDRYNGRDNWSDNYLGSFMDSIPFQSNDAFPFGIPCSECDASGEGETSTYCQRCKGSGQLVVEGMMQEGGRFDLYAKPNVTLITSPGKEKKFAPSFPTGLVPQPSLAKGLA